MGKGGLKAACRQCCAIEDHSWILSHRDKKRKLNHDYYVNNLTEQGIRGKQKYRKVKMENPEKLREWRARESKKNLSTPKGRLNNAISCRIGKALKGVKSGRHWESLAGYTTEQLKKHLEKLFKPGMTWANHGQWHIDHKIPVSAHNIKTAEDIDFKKCWALKNLQPLWAEDNQKKRDKLDKPFQPSLALNVSSRAA